MSDAIERSAVLVDIADHVMTITINRPEARNSITLDVHMAIGRALEQAEHDADVRAVILTGAGDRSFCSGADLKALARNESIVPDDPRHRAWGFAGFVSHPISKPTIAAVNGAAIGGGTELALACDLVIAAQSATFGLPEVKRGIIAGGGGAFRAIRQLPPKIAMEILLTGDSFSAARAFELGLVNKLVPDLLVRDAARELASKIAANAPLAVQATKRVAIGLANGVRADEEVQWRTLLAEARTLMQTQDAREGPRAFAEKRAPIWTSR
jgi:crotonobetainyl-CoA hydratase